MVLKPLLAKTKGFFDCKLYLADNKGFDGFETFSS